MGFDLTKEQNNFIRGDVKVGREGHRDARGHVGRMDDLGIKVELTLSSSFLNALVF